MSSAFTLMQSPVGTLTLVARGECLAAVLWEEERENRVRLGEVYRDDQCPVLRETARQLGEYFAGKRQRFELALDFAGTEFQRQVWAALLAIPFGETRSYSDIARQIGNPDAVRAVGAANGRNPISIIAPCHRVIGAQAALPALPAAWRPSSTCWRWRAGKAWHWTCNASAEPAGDHAGQYGQHRPGHQGVVPVGPPCMGLDLAQVLAGCRRVRPMA